MPSHAMLKVGMSVTTCGLSSLATNPIRINDKTFRHNKSHINLSAHLCECVDYLSVSSIFYSVVVNWVER